MDPLQEHPLPTRLEPAPAGGGQVRLYDDADLAWQPVSLSLRTLRWLVLAVLAAVLTAGIVALAVVGDVRFAWLLLPLAVTLAWGVWLLDRQVRAISWVELTDELVIRRGRFFRSLHAIPYGRLQWVDLRSGPVERALGLGTVIVHTASPTTSGTLPGLPLPVAEALRERLADRGESLRAGL